VKSRIWFLLTAISGMIGMLALIATSLFKSWITRTDITKLSDAGVDELHFLSIGVMISLITSQIAVACFIIFLVLYLVSRNKEASA